MSHNGVSIDQHVYQGLTQAEIALSLTVRDNIQISTGQLKLTDDHTSVMLLAVI